MKTCHIPHHDLRICSLYPYRTSGELLHNTAHKDGGIFIGQEVTFARRIKISLLWAHLNLERECEKWWGESGLPQCCWGISPCQLEQFGPFSLSTKTSPFWEVILMLLRKVPSLAGQLVESRKWTSPHYLSFNFTSKIYKNRCAQLWSDQRVWPKQRNGDSLCKHFIPRSSMHDDGISNCASKLDGFD